MAFSSAVFLFIFLPLSYVLYVLMPGVRSKNALLGTAGLCFYAFGQLWGMGVLLLCVLLSFGFGRAIERTGERKGLFFALAVALDIGVLCVFKYLDFFMGGGTALASLALPVGISFFTFKSISYVSDVYHGRTGVGSFFDVLLYISFFPQVVSGPLSRFGDFAPQLRERRPDVRDAARGLRRLILGLAKKLIIAAPLGAAADAVFAASGGELGARLAWLGAVCYTLQIFFDFSGYSDMAIGLGRMFGFETPENFDHPYAASSITDFWRRWHISLSSWFRDYVYIPLGGSRRGEGRTAVNKFIVFSLCGLWHGANLTFVVWGVWHGLLSALESLRVIDIARLRKTAVGRAGSHIYLLLAVTLGFVMFRASSLSEGFAVIGAMFSGVVGAAETLALQRLIDPALILAVALGVILSLPIGPRLAKRAKALEGRAAVAVEAATYIMSTILLLLCAAAMAGGGFAPFIYAGF